MIDPANHLHPDPTELEEARGLAEMYFNMREKAEAECDRYREALEEIASDRPGRDSGLSRQEIALNALQKR